MTTRPDLARLRAIGAEIQALQDAGQWNEEHFRRLWNQGKAAAHGHGDALEFILVAADDDAWLMVLMEAPR